MNIEWHDAQNRSEHYKKVKKERYDELLEEIENSDSSMLSYLDLVHYAGELNDCNVRKEQYDVSEIRRMLLNGNNDKYDLFSSFVDSEDDDIIDFY